jgi:hypothetical protein
MQAESIDIDKDSPFYSLLWNYDIHVKSKFDLSLSLVNFSSSWDQTCARKILLLFNNYKK